MNALDLLVQQLLCVAEILSPLSLRCVCLDDKERWSPQQLLKHSFINPQPKTPLLEQSPEGESFTILFVYPA